MQGIHSPCPRGGRGCRRPVSAPHPTPPHLHPTHPLRAQLGTGCPLDLQQQQQQQLLPSWACASLSLTLNG